MAIKLYEKESFLKSFGLFFIIIELFLLFIFYNYYKIEEEHLQEQLFLEMKNYSFFFDDNRFDMDIVSKVETNQLYELYFDETNLYILVPFEQDEESSLQITYPLSSYHALLSSIKMGLIWQFLLLSFIAIIISFTFALYALHPFRNAILLLEEFIKDIIHDLNTPITSILINLKMMERNEEVESIEQSATTIAMLHKNLDIYLKHTKYETEKFLIQEPIQTQINFFKPLYSHLTWNINIENRVISSNKNAFSRIVYNLLSNACKYNQTNGFINVKTEGNKLIISNASYGVKNPSKVFERFYKESERGLGIGLHIVDKLCKELNIEKKFTVKENIITVTLIINS